MKNRGVTSRSRLSPVQMEKFLECYKKGVSIEGSCARAGVNKATFYAFLKDAEINPKTGEPYDETAAQFKFLMDLNNDLFESAVMDEMWKQFLKGRWQIGAWLLERKLPNEYGKFKAKEPKVEKKEKKKVKFENAEIKEEGEDGESDQADGDTSEESDV